MKFCPKCKTEKALEEFYKNVARKSGLASCCKPCFSKQNREYNNRHKKRRTVVAVAWNKANPEKVKDIMRRHNHGIEPEDYAALLCGQKGLCAICRDKLEIPNIDHCHAAGIVRGLLCRGCNLGLGNFKDSVRRLRKAIKYLEKFPQQKAGEYQTQRQKQKQKR